MRLVGYVTHGSPDVLRRRARAGLVMIGVLTAATWLLLPLPLLILVGQISFPSMGGSGDFELASFLWTLAVLLPAVAILVAVARLAIACRGGAELGPHYVVGIVLLSVPALGSVVSLGSAPGLWSVAGVAAGIAVLAVGILARRRGT